MIIPSKHLTIQDCDQLTVANFSAFQIVIPTTTQLTQKQIFNTSIPLEMRVYNSQGWLMMEGEEIASIHGLDIGEITMDHAPFKISQRLAPGIPLSFEARSLRTLPTPLITKATLACQIPETHHLFHTVFRGITPRFVKLYNSTATLTLEKIIAAMLADEMQFITEHQSQLKAVPFYRDQFSL